MVTSKESGKRILELMSCRKKGVHFFGKRCCQKCTGEKQQGKKEIEKICQNLRCQLFLSKEIILGHPCIPCARLTRVTIRDGSENKGRSWWGVGGEGQIRGAKG
jgi:hypothetical protein